MSETRKINPWVKAGLEFGPLVLFFVMFRRIGEGSVTIAGTQYSGFIAATLVFIPVMVLATLALWKLTGRLSVMQIMTLVLVVVFGGLSVWLNDARFFKMKPTIIYLLFAGLLGISLMTGRNWLEKAMSEAMPMRAEGWHVLTKRAALFFLALAVANELIWRSMSESTWVNFKTFGMPALTFAFLMANARLFEKYALPRQGGQSSDDQSGNAPKDGV